jgi:hypothetical protein
VSQLQKGQAVMLLPEPSNRYDPGAVAVRNLSGASLGFMPKTGNWQFPHGVPAPASISSTSFFYQSGLHGAKCQCFPTAVPLLPVPLPASFAGSEAAQRLTTKMKPGSEEQELAIVGACGRCGAHHSAVFHVRLVGMLLK